MENLYGGYSELDDYIDHYSEYLDYIADMEEQRFEQEAYTRLYERRTPQKSSGTGRHAETVSR